MVIKSNKKNIMAKDLFTRKYKPRVIKPKKAKVVLKEKSKLYSSTNLLDNF